MWGERRNGHSFCISKGSTINIPALPRAPRRQAGHGQGRWRLRPQALLGVRGAAVLRAPGLRWGHGQGAGSLSLAPWGGSRRALSRPGGNRALSKGGGLTEDFWRSCPSPATSQAALQHFLFLTLLPAWRSCPQATPCWPVRVALEGCTEVADCSDKAYPVTQAVCCRAAFAQRSPCRSQFGHAQTAGLNVLLLCLLHGGNQLPG